METILTAVVAILGALFPFAFQPETSTPGLPSDIAVLAEATTTAVVTRVIDGDTIKVLTGQTELTVRYIGIDTPEPYADGPPACFSAEATARNTELVAGKTVELIADVERTDRYGRQLRYVYVDDAFVNEVLVREGYATALTIKPNDRFADHFIAAEQSAQMQNQGLWDNCDR